MSLVVFFSFKGAPGTTTVTMLTASLWPRPALLADCDPAGGDMGLRLPSTDGRPLDLSRGMLSLLPAARRSLDSVALLSHAQQVLGGGELLVGLAGPEQASAAATGPVWTTIAEAFSALSSHDVIIDVGRLDPRSHVMPLVAASDLAVCVVDSTLSGVYSTRARLRALVPVLRGGAHGGPPLAITVRGKDKRETEIATTLIRSEFPDIIDLGQLTTDPVGAGIFDGRPVSRPERTLLARAGASLVTAILTEIGHRGADTVRTPDQPMAAAPVLGIPQASDLLERPATLSRAESKRSDRAKRSRRSRRGDTT